MNLIDNATKWYKLHSVRLAIVFGALVTYFAANPGDLAALVNALPFSAGVDASILGLAATAIPIAARLIRQPGAQAPTAPSGDQANG